MQPLCRPLCRPCANSWGHFGKSARRKQARYKPARKKLKNVLDLQAAETAARKSLTEFSDMLHDFHWHFQAVQWQNQAYDKALHNLGEDEVLWHFDFKQNVSIP